MPDTLAVLVGLVAGVAGLVLPRFLRSTDDALAIGAVALAALLGGAGLAPLAVVAAVGLLMLAGTQTLPIRVGSLAASAVLLGLAVPDSADRWLGVAAVVGVVVVVVSVESAVGVFGSRPTLGLLAWVPVAVYAAVPDTEEITAVGFALGVLAVGHFWGGRNVSTVGLAGFGALIVWASAVGARGREAAFVTVACLAVLVLAPVAHWLRRSIQWRSPAGLTLSLLHALAGLLVARWAGLGRDVGVAATRAVIVSAIVLVVGTALIVMSPGTDTQSDAG